MEPVLFEDLQHQFESVYMANEKVIQQFTETIVAKYSLVLEGEKKQYFKTLLITFLNGEVEDSEIVEYVPLLVDDPKLKNHIVEEIKALKSPKPAKGQNRLLEKVVRPPAPVPNLKRPAEVEKGKVPEGQPKKRVKQDSKPKEKGEEKEGEKEGEGADKKNLKQELQSKGTQKCRFFPFCKNMQKCGFYHPTQKCSYFPNCRYGEGCLYEHQACKFKEKCSKFNCQFAHPFKKNSNPIEQMMRGFMQQHNPLRHKKKPTGGRPSKSDQPGEEAPQQ